MFWRRSSGVFGQCFYLINCKMEKKEDLLENFKTAIASTVKSISNIENIEVIFGNQNIKTDKKIIKLPDLENVNKEINYAKVRALADSEALKVRFSNLEVLKLNEPQGKFQKNYILLQKKLDMKNLVL